MPDTPHGAYTRDSPGRSYLPAGSWVGGTFYRQGEWYPAGTTSYTIRESVWVPPQYRTGAANTEHITVVHTVQLGKGTTRQQVLTALRERLSDVIQRGYTTTQVDRRFLGVAEAQQRRTGSLGQPEPP